mmetsp:Transcript_34029/g.102532  ORF Transcript_34029/g.102532 Transcript_34029/m.102532 type:complete len:457 (+) Transcript_34029:318-1688(+)
MVKASLLAKTLSPHDEAAPTHPHARSSPHAPPRSLLSRTLSAHEDAATEDASHARTVVGDDGDGLDMSISAKHRPRRQGSNQVNDTHLATKGSSGTKPFSLAGSLTSGGTKILAFTNSFFTGSPPEFIRNAKLSKRSPTANLRTVSSFGSPLDEAYTAATKRDLPKSVVDDGFDVPCFEASSLLDLSPAPVGEGCQARVWSCAAPCVGKSAERGTSARLALKVLRKERADRPGERESFVREALLLNRMTHKNVIRALGCSELSGRRGLDVKISVEMPRRRRGRDVDRTRPTPQARAPPRDVRKRRHARAPARRGRRRPRHSSRGPPGVAGARPRAVITRARGGARIPPLGRRDRGRRRGRSPRFETGQPGRHDVAAIKSPRFRAGGLRRRVRRRGRGRRLRADGRDGLAALHGARGLPPRGLRRQGRRLLLGHRGARVLDAWRQALRGARRPVAFR